MTVSAPSSSANHPPPLETPGSSSPTAPVEIHSGADWDRGLASLPQPHLLQSWAWGEFKAGYGWQPRRLWWSGPSGPAAAQVLRRTAARALRVLYVPKGPLLDWADAPLRDRVLDDLQALARRERAILIKIDPDAVLAAGAPRSEER